MLGYGIFMNKRLTSQEAILEACRILISQKGLAALNVRAVAQYCGVAPGALYYYFPSKDDLLIAAIKSVWDDIFKLPEQCVENVSFPDYIALCFSNIKKGVKKYPNFFTIHSLSVSSKNKDKAHSVMDSYLVVLKKKMQASLDKDTDIKADVFSDSFSKSAFIDFVLMNIVTMLVQKKSNCSFFLEVIKKILY